MFNKPKVSFSKCHNVKNQERLSYQVHLTEIEKFLIFDIQWKQKIMSDTHLTAVTQGQFIPLIRWNNNYACVKSVQFMANCLHFL